MSFASALNHLPLREQRPAERLRDCLALFEEGVELRRRTLRRQDPCASDSELEARLLQWLKYEDAP